METLYPALGLILGSLLGACVAQLLGKSRTAAAVEKARGQEAVEKTSLSERLSAQEEKLEGIQKSLDEARGALDQKERDLEQKNRDLNEEARQKAALEPEASRVPGLVHEAEGLREENSHQKATISELRTKLDEEQKQSAEKLELLSDAQERLKEQFQNVANKILEEKSKKFTDLNKTNLNDILNPLKERIKDFEKKVGETYEKESNARILLKEEIKQLAALNLRMSEDAANLTSALKGESKTQGDWGEMILEKILEDSGLKKGRQYETQESLRDEEGRILRPDVIVHLPEKKDIVIDSKVSLTAYERYFRAEDDEDRERELKLHIQSIRGHLKELSDKSYQNIPGIRTLDFVLMFLPVEGAYLLALERDFDLSREAYERNVLIVSPSTLLATLRMIQNIWRNEDQNRNAQEIAEKAGKMYDKFVGFYEDFEKIGAQLKTVQKTYLGAENKLVSGSGNIVKRASELKDMGAKTKKALPESLLERSEAEPLQLEIEDGVEGEAKEGVGRENEGEGEGEE